MNFIVTKDGSTAEELLRLGFKLLESNEKVFVFLNDVPEGVNFANFDKSKIAYTNMLTF